MPNRTLKDSICTSETIAALDWPAEVFWYRLIVQCDDFGRFDARPAILRARCYPLALDRVSVDDVDGWLQQLADAGLIVLYSADGKPYLQVATWDKHQQKRAKFSKYPAPPSNCYQLIADDSNGSQMSPITNTNTITNHEHDAVVAAVAAWESLGLTVTKMTSDDMIAAVEEWEKLGHPEYVAQAIEVAGRANKRSWSYVQGILRRCRDNGTAPGYTNGQSKVVSFSGGQSKPISDEQYARDMAKQAIYEQCLAEGIHDWQTQEQRYREAGLL